MKVGNNIPFMTGVYVTKNKLAVWDYKIFHTNVDEPSQLIAVEVQTGIYTGVCKIDSKSLEESAFEELEEQSASITFA